MFARAKLKIMFKTTSTLQKLQKKSSDALGVFQATIANLANVNVEIKAEVEVNNKAVDALRSENQLYDKSLKQNEGFINKINEFLGQ